MDWVTFSSLRPSMLYGRGDHCWDMLRTVRAVSRTTATVRMAKRYERVSDDLPESGHPSKPVVRIKRFGGTDRG